MNGRRHLTVAPDLLRKAVFEVGLLNQQSMKEIFMQNWNAHNPLCWTRAKRLSTQEKLCHDFERATGFSIHYRTYEKHALDIINDYKAQLERRQHSQGTQSEYEMLLMHCLSQYNKYVQNPKAMKDELQKRGQERDKSAQTEDSFGKRKRKTVVRFDVFEKHDLHSPEQIDDIEEDKVYKTLKTSTSNISADSSPSSVSSGTFREHCLSQPEQGPRNLQGKTLDNEVFGELHKMNMILQQTKLIMDLMWAP